MTAEEETRRAIEEGRPGYVRHPVEHADPPRFSTEFMVHHWLRRPRRREEPPPDPVPP
ncbi:hypothetical protein ACN27G_06085 [Plantactinospora sp. WMMB334]|uniref:hypothetical protein n=1 Tax=Plantactinospora sp. WMMB334 TaxID=3404119 RepID=UPI003B930574